MKDNRVIDDEVISLEKLHGIHKRLIQRNARDLLDEMLIREPNMYSYVMVAGIHAEEFMAKYHVPPGALKTLNEAVVKRMLICIEAQRTAQYELWRDMMGDPAPDQTNNQPNGDNHG